MFPSLFLAKVLGMFLLIVGLALLKHGDRFLKWTREATKSIPFVLLSGIMILIVGLFIVSAHNLWVHDWRVFITIIGWLMVLKGVVRLFWPEKLSAWVNKFSHRGILIGVVVTLILGLYLTAMGYGLLL